MAVLATILAIYEFALGRRSVPYYSDSIDPSVTTAPTQTHSLREFLDDHEERIVLVDLILNHDGCDTDPTHNPEERLPEIASFSLGRDLHFDERHSRTVSGYSSNAWDANLTIVDAEFDEAVLATSSFGDGSGVQRARGLVYITNEGNEGLSEYKLVPVPFSFEAERVYRCTLAFAEEYIPLLVKRVARACLLT